MPSLGLSEIQAHARGNVGDYMPNVGWPALPLNRPQGFFLASWPLYFSQADKVTIRGLITPNCV